MTILAMLATAWAVGSYPSVVADEVGMPCSPSCTLCHESNRGGMGTVTQPFGRELMKRGLVAGDSGSLRDAIAKLEADAVDSDGDGIADVDELIDGDDPNGGDAFCGLQDVQYGCSTAGYPGVAAVVAAVGISTRRRRAGSRDRG